MGHLKRYLLFFSVAGGVILLDQVSKALVLRFIPLYKSIPVIPGFFSLTHIHNPGGAFGFMAQNNSILRHWLFLAAAMLALVLILYFYQHTPRTHRWLGVALALIFGGAVGNMIDRLRFAQVVDFLDIHVGSFHWPTFNIADSGVTIGVLIFIIHIVFKKMPF